MTTVKQVREVVKPLLERNADLALVGRLVVIKPVRHILRGIYIDRVSSPEIFRPIWAVVFLFKPDARFTFNWGERVYSTLEGGWTVDNPLTPMAMCETIETTALPLLRPVQTVEDFVAFTTKERFPWTALNLYKDRKIFVDLASGDFASARDICAYLTDDHVKKHYQSGKWADDYNYITDTVCPLVATEDKIGIAKLLHDLEAAAVKKEKLEKFWEPTPFPIEAGL